MYTYTYTQHNMYTYSYTQHNMYTYTYTWHNMYTYTYTWHNMYKHSTVLLYMWLVSIRIENEIPNFLKILPNHRGRKRTDQEAEGRNVKTAAAATTTAITNDSLITTTSVS